MTTLTLEKADIGRRQRRCVVDAVADHGDPIDCREGTDFLGLVARQHVRVHVVRTNTDGACHCVCGAGVVARDQHGAQAERMQGRDGLT